MTAVVMLRGEDDEAAINTLLLGIRVQGGESQGIGTILTHKHV